MTHKSLPPCPPGRCDEKYSARSSADNDSPDNLPTELPAANSWSTSTWTAPNSLDVVDRNAAAIPCGPFGGDAISSSSLPSAVSRGNSCQSPRLTFSSSAGSANAACRSGRVA